MTLFVQTTEVADLQARVEALEAVLLQVIAERDRALAELERMAQEPLFAGEPV